ncbi:uncharacterized protein LOC108733461 [Agrilus planipennis]|uniref:Uncharacterized protein LOC108733461 n=1 Tax=Agrilus planipennis TaxID=224129 RepID=A0A1W4W7R9_AGRPL|nr:uncharacterized protein LOC108733461 [Agrilus planipennis]
MDYANEQQTNLVYQSFPANNNGINPTETSVMQSNDLNNKESVIYTDLTVNHNRFSTEAGHYPSHENYGNNAQYHSPFDEVLMSLAKIETRLTNIEKLLRNSNDTYEDDFNFPPGFPLKTLEEFDSFENEINEDRRQKMVDQPYKVVIVRHSEVDREEFTANELSKKKNNKKRDKRRFREDCCPREVRV